METAVPGRLTPARVYDLLDGSTSPQGEAARPAARQQNLLLYVHIPFCSSKCSFCFWVAGISARELRADAGVREEYVAALTAQLRAYAPLVRDLGYVIRHVYWGGGTPSILTPDQITELGDTVATCYDLSHVEEFSVESSPETLSVDKVAALSAVGMNRLSIGVQSFDEAELRLAGRAHSADQAVQAVGIARDAGVTNLNLDLITGFPRQTAESLGVTLDKCVALAPEHVTAYSYTPVVSTVMGDRVADGKLGPLTVGRQRGAQKQAASVLTKNGYEEYMQYYFALRGEKPFGAERYYFAYEGDYVGFGSGAHSRLAHHVLMNSRGKLREFLADPTGWDVVSRFAPDSRVPPFGRIIDEVAQGGPAVANEPFRAAFGFDVSELEHTELVHNVQARLKRRGRQLVFDDHGVRLDKAIGT